MQTLNMRGGESRDQARLTVLLVAYCSLNNIFYGLFKAFSGSFGPGLLDAPLPSRKTNS
jgi:hypothetical protein